jgi:hypothetical protein
LPLRALAPLARHAISVQIYDAQLGTAEECTRLAEPTKSALTDLAVENQNLSSLKEPTERVRTRAIYRNAQETVPLVESVGDLAIQPKQDAPAFLKDRVPEKVNVLVDDYWSIAQVLLH